LLDDVTMYCTPVVLVEHDYILWYWYIWNNCLIAMEHV
jgi:hypothetical protein